MCKCICRAEKKQCNGFGTDREQAERRGMLTGGAFKVHYIPM